MKRTAATGRYKLAELQQKTQVTNLIGGVEYNWARVRAIFVKLKPKTGNERDRGAATTNPHTYTGYTRYALDIIEAQRILLDGRYYSITSVFDPTGEGLELEMELVKQPSEGEAL